MSLAYRLIVSEDALFWWLFGVAIFAAAIALLVVAGVRFFAELWTWLHEDALPAEDDPAERRRLDVTTRIPVSRS